MFNKAISFTDIHWGARSNSEQHLDDCDVFIQWVIEAVKQDEAIDHIIFMGDWFENRSSINIQVLSRAYDALVRLTELGLPIFMIVGNHDCYYRHTRDIHSLHMYRHLPNVTVIDKLTTINTSAGEALLAPYLFHHEYETVKQSHGEVPVWWGHFEFNGFVITGHDIKMQTGADPTAFVAQRRIFSGHFHKQQTVGNVTYIGNAFPTTYGDQGDYNRGCATYEYATDELSLLVWTDCPKFTRVRASSLAKKCTLPQGARVKCVDDVGMAHQDAVDLRAAMMERFSLREFNVLPPEVESMETTDLQDIISDDSTEVTEHSSVDQLVVALLSSIKSDTIDSNVLVDQYNKL